MKADCMARDKRGLPGASDKFTDRDLLNWRHVEAASAREEVETALQNGAGYTNTRQRHFGGCGQGFQGNFSNRLVTIS